MNRYTYATTLSFGTDGEPSYSEIEVEVSFACDFGQPESGRFGPPEDYDPGSGDEIHSIILEKVEGKPRPWNLGYAGSQWGLTDDQFAETVAEMLDADRHQEAMRLEAIEEAAGRDDDAREARWEAQREDRRRDNPLEPDYRRLGQ